MEHVTNTEETKTAPEQQVKLTGLDKVAYNLDQPITWGGFIAKAVVNGVIMGVVAGATAKGSQALFGKVRASIKRGDHKQTPSSNNVANLR